MAACEGSVFCTVEEALEDLRAGRMIIVVDDEDRENEGDLLAAAEKATPEVVNFMATFGRGLICAPVTSERADLLGLPPMTSRNTDPHGTAFTISVDAAEGSTTGISAAERAHTVTLLADQNATSESFRTPGHVFPLRARPGGVLRRAGHTEAAVDLTRMAGLAPAGVICEIMNDDGTMARLDDLQGFAAKHHLRIFSIAQLIQYRTARERLVERVASVQLPTEHGEFLVLAYRSCLEEPPERLHLALVKGDVKGKENVLVRVHSECLTGDVFGSLRCDCGPQLHRAMERIEQEGCGVVLYMRQEGRGIGLFSKLKAYELQEQGFDTVEANKVLGFAPDLRDYGLGAQILADLGLRSLRLLTNNPRKIAGLQGHGLQVTARMPLEVDPNPHNERYLEAKREKMGHLLHLQDVLR